MVLHRRGTAVGLSPTQQRQGNHKPTIHSDECIARSVLSLRLRGVLHESDHPPWRNHGELPNHGLQGRRRLGEREGGWPQGRQGRNFLVPVPSLESFEALNAHLERRCLARMTRGPARQCVPRKLRNDGHIWPALRLSSFSVLKIDFGLEL